MSHSLLATASSETIPLLPISVADYPSWLMQQSDHWQQWLQSSGFEARSGSYTLLPAAEGGVEAVLLALRDASDFWAAGALPLLLPQAVYRLDGELTAELTAGLALAWGLGSYQFERYKSSPRQSAQLLVADGLEPVIQQVEAIALTRDLINTPAQDMLPPQLAMATEQLANQFGAEFSQTIGEQLLADNFPAIHAVGRASEAAPRLLDFSWGAAHLPRVTLVGKGVCFDSGGLDIKPSSAMRQMKKDMGGAAHVLGLAAMIMAAKLPVRLRVLIPAVENAIAGNAFRPGDVLNSRLGKTIEVDNTDAEGRLVLCDALALAAEESPELLIDFATLTGAARVAVGTEIAAMFANRDAMANELTALGSELQDSIWRLPLHADYRALIDSKVADIANSASAPYGGAITAALFLQEFVPAEIEWLHFDVMAWNIRPRPGRPEGGEAMGLRALFAYLQRRFG